MIPLTWYENIHQTLDYFLQCIEKDVEDTRQTFFGFEDHTVSEEVVFITSKDVEAITSGATRPATAFTSPFLGESIEQVSNWFDENIEPISNGFTGISFLVMDSRTVEDNTCLLVCAEEEDKLQTLRCDFKVAQSQITSIEFGNEGMENGIRDLFLETGEVMTKEKFHLALDGQLYVDSEKRLQQYDQAEYYPENEEPFDVASGSSKKNQHGALKGIKTVPGYVRDVHPPNCVEHDGRSVTVQHVAVKEACKHLLTACNFSH